MVVLLERKFSAEALGLQQLQFHLQPYERNLEVLVDVARTVEERNLRGGALLVELENAISTYAGDKVACSLLQDIANACATPFLSMFVLWITEGRIDDPCGEFFVRPCTERDPLPDRALSLPAVLAFPAALHV